MCVKCISVFSGSNSLNLVGGIYLLMLILSAEINGMSCRTQICIMLYSQTNKSPIFNSHLSLTVCKNAAVCVTDLRVLIVRTIPQNLLLVPLALEVYSSLDEVLMLHDPPAALRTSALVLSELCKPCPNAPLSP